MIEENKSAEGSTSPSVERSNFFLANQNKQKLVLAEDFCKNLVSSSISPDKFVSHLSRFFNLNQEEQCFFFQEIKRFSIEIAKVRELAANQLVKNKIIGINNLTLEKVNKFIVAIDSMKSGQKIEQLEFFMVASPKMMRKI